MIFLELFLVFFKVGLFTFGGGYAMVPIIKQEMLSRGWISEEMIVNFIGISEATPGPIAINLATFAGNSVGMAAGSGLFGSLCATLGVVLPSFIIILLVAAVFKQFRSNKIVAAALKGIKPVVAALIAATGVMLAVKCFAVNFEIGVSPQFDFIALGIMIFIAAASVLYKKFTKKELSPIIMILVSAGLGMLSYTFFF